MWHVLLISYLMWLSYLGYTPCTMQHLGTLHWGLPQNSSSVTPGPWAHPLHHVKSRWQRLRAAKDLSSWQLYETFTLLTWCERTGTKSRIWHCNSFHSIYIVMKPEKNLWLTFQSRKICFPALHWIIQWLVVKLFFLTLCHSFSINMCWISSMSSWSIFCKMDLGISHLWMFILGWFL